MKNESINIDPNNIAIINRDGVAVRLSTETERTEFTNQLSQHIKPIIDRFGYNRWWITGGLARDALMGVEEFVTHNPEGQLRDVDIISERSILSEINHLLPYDTDFKIGLCAYQQFLLDINTDSQSFLRKGNKRFLIPSKTVETQIVELNGVYFPTLPLPTLFHLYFPQQNGQLRQKDFVNALAIGRYLKQHPDISEAYPEELYAQYHQFHKVMYNGFSLHDFLYDMAFRYRNSAINSILPINGNLKPIMMSTAKILGV